jgi:hypothetical protein
MLLMMKTHCQPWREVRPCRPEFMAVIMTPANMLPTCPMAVKMAVRLAISSGLLKLKLAAVFYTCEADGLLPRSQNVYGATVQTSLEKALEEPYNAELSISLTSCRTHRQPRPNEQRER